MNSSTIPLPIFQKFNFSLLINKPLLLLFLLAFFVVYLIISAVLAYHWSSYGMRNPGIIFARSLFILVSIILFVVAVLAISYL